MCGLAGALLTRREAVSRDALAARGQAMADLLHHRGPDGRGVWTDGQALLVHTRLAIIDVSAAANQPMHDAEGEIHVVFNGEIYNFLELKRELLAKGHRFANASDTAVIIAGYREWGDAVVERLSGMFAIALWDSKRRRMLFARDRFGEKPLYYAMRPEGIVFASEIKGILAWPGVPRVPDREQIHDYMTFGFTLGPTTAFLGIERLQPAHVMTVEAGGRAEIRRYWALPAPETQRARDPEDLKRELIERLAHVVKRCMISDVPLGAFLSGGVDSSAVVAMMARAGGAGIKTFSSGFGFGDYDETRFAGLVAERYRTEHRSFRFGAGLLRHMSLLSWHYGEPYSDSSALVTYALARETRKHVTVALTGDGADETFLGYARYFAYGDIRRDPARARARRFSGLYDTVEPQGEAARLAATDAYGFLMERFREHQKLRGYDLGFLPHLERCSYERLLPHFVADAAPEEAAARMDCGVYLPDNLTVKVDVAAMASGLETRAPFLDHELAAWAAGIPAHQRVWNREGKALLKSALEPHLPHECMYRTKVGFRVPVAKFMREEVRRQTDDMLTGDRFLDRGLVRADFVREMLVEHRGQREEHGTRLWTLMALELWFRTWIDKSDNKPLTGADDPFAELAEDAKLERYEAGAGDDEDAPAAA